LLCCESNQKHEDENDPISVHMISRLEKIIDPGDLLFIVMIVYCDFSDCKSR